MQVMGCTNYASHGVYKLCKSWGVQIMQVMGCTNCIRKSMLKYYIPQENVYPTMALITQYGQHGLVV